MIQLIVIIYLSISINSIAKEKDVSPVPYILGTIAITILPSLCAMLIMGGISALNIVAALFGIALAFIPRSLLRAH